MNTRPCNASIFLKIIVLLILCGSPAAANSFPEISGWWISAGGTTGLNKKKMIYGGEASFIYIAPKSVAAWGIVVDYLHDNALRSNRMMIGPEIAYFFCGVDGGLTMNFRNGKTKAGYSLRPFITFPFFVSPVAYYRYTKIYNVKQNNIHEFGIQIKIALPLHAL